MKTLVNISIEPRYYEEPDQKSGIDNVFSNMK